MAVSVNKQNKSYLTTYKSIEPPHWMGATYSMVSKINVWAGMIGQHIIDLSYEQNTKHYKANSIWVYFVSELFQLYKNLFILTFGVAFQSIHRRRFVAAT